MLNLNEFKKKVGVTKNVYVQEWLDENLIPGVIRGATLEDTQFPNSSRRPYRDRWLKPGIDAEKIRAHIIAACIKRQHISKEACYASEGEFRGYIEELEQAQLLRIRVEDGVEYYDSTLKSDAYEGRKLKEIREFIIDALKAVSEGVAQGTVTAILENEVA